MSENNNLPVYVIVDAYSEEYVTGGKTEKECLDSLIEVIEADGWDPEVAEEMTLRMYKMVKDVEIEWTPKVRAV